MHTSYADRQMERLQLQRLEGFVRETETRLSQLQAVVGRLGALGQTPEAARLATQALQNALEAVRECQGVTAHLMDGLDTDE